MLHTVLREPYYVSEVFKSKRYGALSSGLCKSEMGCESLHLNHTDETSLCGVKQFDAAFESPALLINHFLKRTVYMAAETRRGDVYTPVHHERGKQSEGNE